MGCFTIAYPPDPAAAKEARAADLAPLLLLLLVFVGVRVLLAWRSPLHLFQGEEYVHFRLYRQLLSEHPVGELGRYAYGDARGLTGGGSVVLSLLYVILSPLVGTGYWATKLMAIAWATAGATALAVLARRCFGPPAGAVAVGALLCMPPSYAIHSSVAWGNHAEGGVLVVLALLCFGRAADPAARWRPGAALGLGFLLPFGPWFWPPAAITSALLIVPAAVSVRGAAPRAALAAGLAAGLVGWATVSFDRQIGGAGETLGEAAVAAVERVEAAGGVLPVVRDALAAVPAYEVEWAGRWTPPTALRDRGGPAFRAAAWGAVAWMLLSVPLAAVRERRWRLRSREVAVLAAGGFVLLLPLALVLAGEALPRRLTPVYLLWGLAFAGPVGWALGPGPLRSPRVVAAGLVLAAGLSPTLLLATSGGPPEHRFAPETFALCPAGMPMYESGACVRDLSEAHLPLLARLEIDPRLSGPSLRSAALRGFDDAAGSAYAFALVRQLAPCPPGVERAQPTSFGADHDALAWEYFSAALTVSCGDEALGRCLSEAPAELRAACRVGAALPEALGPTQEVGR